jgi:hypothetical protein
MLSLLKCKLESSLHPIGPTTAHLGTKALVSSVLKKLLIWLPIPELLLHAPQVALLTLILQN